MRGTVTQISRRFASIFLENGEIADVQLLGKFMGLTLGDTVSGTLSGAGFEISAIDERRNLFRRTLGERTKEIAANVDQIYIVAAIAPLFNTIFIDRIIAAAITEAIPVSLIVNKVDLGLEDTEHFITAYKKLSLPIFYCSAKSNIGLEPIFESMKRSHNKIVALCGISGVGKSTIINKLFNNQDQRTGEVSNKTGQGKQTTSEAKALIYNQPERSPLYIVDLPGIQNFAVTHLLREDLNFGFTDINAFAANCEFRDCSHIKEDKCAVKVAVTSGEIAASRYESYLNILTEINSFKKY